MAFHWRGEEGEEREVTYADLHRDVQRFANALKDRGIGKGDVVGIYLPDGPRAGRRDARLRADRRPHNVVFGGFSPDAVKERMEFSDAKALVTIDGARRKGKTAPIKQQVDEKIGDVQSIETIFVVRHTGEDCEMQDGRDVWFDEALEAADDECEPEPLDAEHPLYVLYTSGSTAKPKGVLHTTGGYLLGVTCTHRYVFDLKPDTDVYWCAADVGWVTGHSYIVYGPLSQRRDQRHVRGRARLSGQGHLVVAHRALWGDDPVHGADRDPRLHEVGSRASGQARPLVAAPARHASASPSTRRRGSGTTR